MASPGRGVASGYGEVEGGTRGGLAVVEDHEDLSMEVRHLSAQLGTLSQEVGTIEARQVALDRRLVEFGGLVQGLQEEQYTQSLSLKHSQKALACGAQRALDTAVAVQKALEQEDAWETCMERMGDSGVIQQLEKRWEARLEEHTQWLMELQSDVAAMTLEGPPAAHASEAARLAQEAAAQAQEAAAQQAREAALAREVRGAGGTQTSASGPLDERISALERSQRAVAISARRALQTAIIVHQQQRSQDQADGVEKDGEGQREALGDLVKPVAELEQQCAQRFTSQDERLDKILQMVDALADRVVDRQRPALQGAEGTGGERAPEGFAAVGELREKVDELEANVFGLAAQLQAQLKHAQQQASFGEGGLRERAEGGVSREGFLAAMESLEARVDRSLSEVDRSLAEAGQRLDSLQEGRDQQRLSLRQIGNELPEVSQKLDQLWAQCQYYFPRVKEHDVHFSFFRTSFETHKQHMLDFTDTLEHGCFGEHGPSGNLPSGRLAEPFKPPSSLGGDRLRSGISGAGVAGSGLAGTGLAGTGLADWGLGEITDPTPLFNGDYDMVFFYSRPPKFRRPWSIDHPKGNAMGTICNSMMASVSKHPFWLFVAQRMLKAAKEASALREKLYTTGGWGHKFKDVMWTTGSSLLTDSLAEYQEKFPDAIIGIFSNKYWSPWRNDAKDEVCEGPKACSQLHPDAFTVHHWTGSWNHCTPGTCLQKPTNATGKRAHKRVMPPPPLLQDVPQTPVLQESPVATVVTEAPAVAPPSEPIPPAATLAAEAPAATRPADPLPPAATLSAEAPAASQPAEPIPSETDAIS